MATCRRIRSPTTTSGGPSPPDSGCRATTTSCARCARRVSPSAHDHRRRVRRELRGVAATRQTLRNPLYHWTHLELEFSFGVGKLLGPSTAKEIHGALQRQAGRGGILGARAAQYDAKVVLSTDDPVGPSGAHRRHAKNTKARTKPCLTWRPDKALALHDPGRLATSGYGRKLSAVADGPRSATSPACARCRSGTTPCCWLPRVGPRPGAHLRGALHGGRGAGASRCRPSK